MGVRSVSFDWRESYLTHRDQIVQVEYYNQLNNTITDIASPKEKAECSFPPGSILFIIYINGITKCIIYSDDCDVISEDYDLTLITF